MNANRPPRERFVLTLEEKPADAPERLLLLDGGHEAYPRMLAALGLATRSVHLEAYAFEVSGVGARFVEALQQAAIRGVDVSVVIAGWGSVRGGRAVAAALRRRVEVTVACNFLYKMLELARPDARSSARARETASALWMSGRSNRAGVLLRTSRACDEPTPHDRWL